jgi:hypothetical protein
MVFRNIHATEGGSTNTHQHIVHMRVGSSSPTTEEVQVRDHSLYGAVAALGVRAPLHVGVQLDERPDQHAGVHGLGGLRSVPGVRTTDEYTSRAMADKGRAGNRIEALSGLALRPRKEVLPTTLRVRGQAPAKHMLLHWAVGGGCRWMVLGGGGGGHTRGKYLVSQLVPRRLVGVHVARGRFRAQRRLHTRVSQGGHRRRKVRPPAAGAEEVVCTGSAAMPSSHTRGRHGHRGHGQATRLLQRHNTALTAITSHMARGREKPAHC